MTVTIQLSDEQAAALQAQAAEQGLTVDAWLQRLAEQYAHQRAASSAAASDNRPIWEVIVDNMKDVPPEVMASMPEDGASQHDHYIYGWPKREV
jgi:hypothetical protein